MKQEENLDISKQLEEMKDIKDGWAEGMQVAYDWGKIPGGYGKAPNHLGLNWLNEQFERNYPKNLPLPYLYPTPEGGVQAEWSIGRWECSLEIDILRHFGEWHAYNLDTEQSIEATAQLDSDAIWSQIFSSVSELYGKESK